MVDVDDDVQIEESVMIEERVGPADDDGSIKAIRELVLKAHPGVVPELVQGESIEALLDSVEPAREAFARIVEELAAKSEGSTVRAAPRVPAGGMHAPALDIDALPPSEMLRRGVAKG